MPEKKISSAKKRHLQSVKLNIRNKSVKSRINTTINRFKTLKEISLLPFLYKLIDKAVKKNTIKSNKGSRMKSKLALLSTSW